MKRFGLFFAVFSIGFVLFLVISDQLGRMFNPDENPFLEEDPESNAVVDENWVEFQCPDPKRGHLFTLRGQRDNPGALLLEQSSGIDGFGNLVNAEVIFPLGTDLDGGTRITAERVTLNRAAKKIELGGEIIVRSPPGETANETRGSLITRDVTVDWSSLDESNETPPSENAKPGFVLSGSQPITIESPALEALGESGFVGRLDDQQRIQEIVLEPPVTLALSPTRGGEIFGMSQPSPDAAPKGEPSDEADRSTDPATPGGRVIVHSAGPVTLVQGASGQVSDIQFSGVVHVWRVEKYAGLSPAPEIPAIHFRCEQLMLEIPAGGRQVERAIARSARAIANDPKLPQSSPLTFNFSDPDGTYSLVGDRLVWERNTGMAQLFSLSRVEFRGPWGRFSAGRGIVDLNTRDVELHDGVDAKLIPSQIGQLDAERFPRLGKPFELAAHRVDFTLASRDRPKGALPIKKLIALGSSETPVTFREAQLDGLRLTGDRLELDGEKETLILSSRPELPGRRPLIREGSSLATADVIRGSFADLDLWLEGRVEGKLFDLARFQAMRQTKDDSTPSEPKDSAVSPPDSAIVASDSLHLAWAKVDDPDAKMSQPGLEFVEARGTSDRPLSVTYERAGVDYRFLGEHLLWESASEALTLKGEQPQRLFMQEDGLEISGDMIQAEVATRTIRASGSVHAIAEKNFLDGQELETMGTGRAELRGDALTLTLAPARSKDKKDPKPGDTAETEGSDTSDGTAMPFGLAQTRILAAQLDSADSEQPVTATDGVLTLTGGSIAFDGATGVTRITGEGARGDEPGRQQVVYDSPEGKRALRGRSIGLVPDGDRALIEIEQCDGDLVQSGKRDKTLVWRVRADRSRAWLKRAIVTSEDESRTRIELDEVQLSGDLRVSNEALQLSLHGDSAHWTRESDCLRLLDRSGRGLQNFRHGPAERQDEVLARKISVLADVAASDRVIVLLEDVVTATFHLRKPNPRPNEPREFQLVSRELLVRLTQPAESTLPDEDQQDRTTLSHDIDEAFAWGDVRFQADGTQILCERVEYVPGSSTGARDPKITFWGKGGQKPQIVEGENLGEVGNPMVVIPKSRGGFRFELPKGLDRQGARDLSKILERFRSREEERR